MKRKKTLTMGVRVTRRTNKMVHEIKRTGLLFWHSVQVVLATIGFMVVMFWLFGK